MNTIFNIVDYGAIGDGVTDESYTTGSDLLN